MFALCAAAAVAQEEKKDELKLIKPLAYGYPYTAGFPYAYGALPAYTTGLPLAYNTPAFPLAYLEPERKKIEYKLPELKPLEYKLPEIKPITYTYQPVQTKFVPKEYEVPVHTVEYEAVGTMCENAFGQNVPCKKAKRSAEEMKEEEKKALQVLPYGLSPFGYNTAALPYAYGSPLAYSTPYAAYASPLAYTVPRPVEYKALEPKIQEIEVPKPVLKKVVTKIQVGPTCFNGNGFPVLCAQYE